MTTAIVLFLAVIFYLKMLEFKRPYMVRKFLLARLK